MKKKIAFAVIASAMMLVGCTTGMPTPRTGRLFQSSRYPHYSILRGAEMLGGGIMTVNPVCIVASPFVFVGDLVLSPVYDILCLPRDLYIRNRLGVIVRIHELDGSPVAGVRCGAMMPATKDNGHYFTGETYETGPDGTVYIPFCRDLISIHGIDQSLEKLGYEAFPYDAYHFAPPGVLDVLALRRGVQYPALCNELDLVCRKDRDGCFVCDIGLLAERVDMPPSGVGMRFRMEYDGKLRMSMLATGDERTVRMKKSEMANADMAARLASVPYENRLDACHHLERGLAEDEVIAFQSYSGGMYRGVITALTVEDDKTGNSCLIHLQWYASPQKDLPYLTIDQNATGTKTGIRRTGKQGTGP